MKQDVPIRLLLMCDRPIEREGIRLILINQPGIVLAGCTDADPEQPSRSDQEADVILIDIDSETRDVVEHLPKVIAVAGKGRILVLAGTAKEELFRHVARLGAMGVVSKDQGVETLVKAIRKVHSGEVWFDRTMMAGLLRQIAQPVGQSCDEVAALKISALTRREREVIQHLGQGLNAEVIAERLFISETTVRHHLSSILEKLEVHDRFDLVFYAYRHGLAVPPPPPDLDNSI